MTDNPIETLDRQLRGAVSRRRRRRQVRRRGAIALVAAVVLGGGVAAASQLVGSGSGSGSAADRAISAGQQIASQQGACDAKRGGPPQLVPDPVPADVTRKLGVFRRAPTPADRFATQRLGFSGTRLLENSRRIATASDGTRFAMFISYGKQTIGGGETIDAGICLRAALRAALAQPAAKDPAVRDEINRRLGAQIEHADALVRGQDHFLTIDTLDSRGNQVVGAGTVLRNGKVPAVSEVGQVRHGNKRYVSLAGLVPDGIHDVRILDDSGPKGARAPARVVRVHENVYHAVLPRRTGPRISVQWRARDGHVLRTTHLVY